MFAYCRNNPVRRIDITGTADADCFDNDILDEEDLLKDSRGGNDQTGEKSGSNGNSNGTVIYRYGYTGPEKLVPTQDDIDSNTGLSFSTKYKPGAAKTTIESVNSTGTLTAIQDGRFHVSVYPINGTINDWFNAGVQSVWTQSLISVVVMS